VAELRKVVDERDARACLSAVARSGASRRDWARRNGIDPRSLHALDMNLGGRSATKPKRPAAPGPQLVELVPVTAPRTPRRYVVRVGAASVAIGDDFDGETLRRVEAVLRAC
jgi:hypothetical protein